MPNFWTNTYGLGGDPYATLRLTAQGSRMGIPLSGAGVEMQEIKLLNKFEALGKQEKAADFAAELTKKTRGEVNFTKNKAGRWIRGTAKELEEKAKRWEEVRGGYEPEPGQDIEMTKMKKVYNMDEIMPSDAQIDFARLEDVPELGKLDEIQGYDELKLDETELEAEWDELEAEWAEAEAEYGEIAIGPLAEDAILEAEATEDYIALARQVALVAAEAAEEITEVTVMGVLGSMAGGLLSAAVMVGMTIGGQQLLKWIAKRHMDKTSDDEPLQGAVGYFATGKMLYPMWMDIIEHKIWFIYFRDITGFWRPYHVKKGDERVRLLKPVRKSGSGNMKPLMYFGNPPKLVKVPFYAPIPVGTRIRRTDLTYEPWKIKGELKTGTIRRGMIFNQYKITNAVGNNDKYYIEMDSGEHIYLPVYKFMIDASNFKAKQRPHGRPLPSVITEKANFKKRKDDVQAQKVWRKVHSESSHDRGQGVYTNQSAIARMIREDKRESEIARRGQVKRIPIPKKKEVKPKIPWPEPPEPPEPPKPFEIEPKPSPFEIDVEPLLPPAQPVSFVTCPAKKHNRRLTAVGGHEVVNNYGESWDVFVPEKWAALQYDVKLSVSESVKNLVEFFGYPDPCANIKDIQNPTTFLVDRPVKQVTWDDLQHRGRYPWPSESSKVVWGYVMKGKMSKQSFSPRQKGVPRSRSGVPPIEFFLGWTKSGDVRIPQPYYLERLDRICNGFNYIRTMYKNNATFKAIYTEKKSGYQLFDAAQNAIVEFRKFLKTHKIAYTHGQGFMRIEKASNQLPPMSPVSAIKEEPVDVEHVPVKPVAKKAKPRPPPR